MNFIIYCITDINGYFYIGSTTKNIKERLRLHINSSKIISTPMFDHFKKIGWDKVFIEEIYKDYGDKTYRLLKESEIILQNIDDPYCLNKRTSFIAESDKKKEQCKRVRKYQVKNRNKVLQYNRDYYYRSKYGITEEEYKLNKVN